MRKWKSNFGIGVLILLTSWISLIGLYEILKPINNGCKMTYMFPNYIPIQPHVNGVSSKYGLYLYLEGWKKKDFDEHLKHLNGIPVLFIPGNGGSYKQVRSLGAESDKAFQRGLLDKTFYDEGYLEPEEGGAYENAAEDPLPNQYQRRLDWFSVDLQGEYSAMDSQTLEDHTEYVVYAVHRILDHYKASRDRLEKEGAATSIILPKSVILVGHSMGGFVARAAVVHPRLRKASVETIITLSSPHQLPPVAFQPSLSHYYLRVNEAWKMGYTPHTSAAGHYHIDPPLAQVIVISVSGGYNDYQVRTRLESLSDIVPPTHGFMISSTSMRNVWLSMEHQVILWCNQLVVQVSHTLLSITDPRTRLPVSDPGKRLAVFSRMLRSGSAHTSHLHDRSYLYKKSSGNLQDAEQSYGFNKRRSSSCPNHYIWNDDDHEKDIYIRDSTLTVLAMDGKRRWMDIHNLSSNGKSHFAFVTNFFPCSGVRIHLWREKGRLNAEHAADLRVVEVTTRLVNVPSGMAKQQTEPGGQTEQAPPSAMIFLHPHDMSGFRFLTISVAHQPFISGRPAPAASMAVGQFFNPEDGLKSYDIRSILSAAGSRQELMLRKDHPLAVNFSFAISLGLLPMFMSVNTTGCGIVKVTEEGSKDDDASRLCKFLCFPPLALVWDATSGLHVLPNIYHGTIIVDSFPASKFSASVDEKTIMMLLVDPHCSYNINMGVVKTVAASRFLLLYSSKVFGFCVAIIFYAIMRQALAWQRDLSTPSLSSAVNSNLDLTFSFWLLGIAPITISLLISSARIQSVPSFGVSSFVAILCYLFANGVMFLVSIVSRLSLGAMANIHVSFKSRYQKMGEDNLASFTHRSYHSLSSLTSVRVVRIITGQSLSVTCVMAIVLSWIVHPGIGLCVLLAYHVATCHYALCSYVREMKRFHSKDENGDATHASSSSEESSKSPKSAKSFGESQLEIFHHHHALLILHSFAAFMFFPSLLSWFHRMGSGYKSPWLVDFVVCVGVILNGVLNPKPGFNTLISFPFRGKKNIFAHFIYLLGGYYCFFCGLNFEPFGVLYAISAAGFLSLAFRILGRGDLHSQRSKRSHRH